MTAWRSLCTSIAVAMCANVQQPVSPQSWISWVNVALGTWLVVSAFVFAHPRGVGITEDVIAGLFVCLAALWSAAAFRPYLSLIASVTVILTGFWVMIAPFVLGYERESAAVANDLMVGMAITALGAAGMVAKSKRLA